MCPICFVVITKAREVLLVEPIHVSQLKPLGLFQTFNSLITLKVFYNNKKLNRNHRLEQTSCVDIGTFIKHDFNSTEATSSNGEFDLLNIIPHEYIPKRKYVMSALHDMGMQVVSEDSVLHFNEQYFDDEGDYLPFKVNGKEV